MDTDLLSLDWPAVAMRLEEVMKAKSPQVLLWHCQLCKKERNERKQERKKERKRELVCLPTYTWLCQHKSEPSPL